MRWITFDPATEVSQAQEREEPSLEAALEQLTESEDPTARAEAAQALGLIGDTTALPGLVEAMEKDSDLDVRLSALTAVQRLDFDVLVWILLTHDDSETRAAAARALSALRDLRAMEPFFQALSGDESPQVRVEAARGLAHIGRDRAEGQLLLAATVDEDAAVRAAAVRSLGNLKTTWTARQLVSILSSDPDSQVREASAFALGEIRAAIALRPLLEARSEDEVETVRLAAGRALRMWSDPGLLSILQESREARERAAAAELLGEREYTTAIPALSSALYDLNDEVRRAALAALGNMGELTWLENGNGLLRQAVGDFALIPGTTAERTAEIPRTPVFRLLGGTHTNLLRTAVGDYYVDGKWVPKEHLRIGLNDVNGDVTEADVLRTVNASSVHRDEILAFSTVLGGNRFLPGAAPISTRLESVSAPGTYWPNSATYVLSDLSSSFAWVSEIHDFSTDVLSAADRWPTSPEYPYAELQDHPWLGRASELAANITDGQTTTYGKANAIEQFLKSEYTYRFADTNEASLPPPGRDPVDWFLFESLEGTSGSFSSAFVILARLVGIPSRVVSGWVVIVDSEPQTICSDQAHQWAEVAFDGPGWVAFNPTPGGAPFRAALRCDPADRERALWELERRNYKVTSLENGSVLIGGDGQGGGGGQVTFSPGTTTQQATKPPPPPVFNVSGAANTSYLRTAVGDAYAGGYWTQLDPVTSPYSAGNSVPSTVRSLYSSPSGQFASLPEYRRETESLFGFLEGFDSSHNDRIRINPAGDFTELPAGLAPTSLHLQSADRNGAVYPFSSTFSTNDSMGTFSWTAEIPSYSAAQYAGAVAASDPTYTQLPEDLPERIRELALTITAGHATAYAKAKALERYLKTNYTYSFADDSGEGVPPPGRDPIDWFLFDHREGTCGVFSSAFVVLARSVGIPARVVSGWAISATDDSQTVYADQAHQWAEVAFEGLGWVKFEPTAPGGAPSRAPGAGDGDGSGDAEGDGAGVIGESGAGAALGSGDPAEREAALEELEEQGADVARLENGGAFIDQGGLIGFSPGTTTRQAKRPFRIPVFNVRGAAHTSYLRTSTGDVYENGGWRQLNPINVPYVSGKDVPDTVRALYDSPAAAFASLPSWRRATASLFGFGTMPQRVVSDLIQVYPAGTFSRLPYGMLPTSLLLRSISLNGVIHPFSSTFSTDLSVESFSWFADIPSYSAGQHNSAVAASDFTYTQLPSDMPERIRQLAMGITAGHSTPYAKAKALERYLKTNYTYRFADPSGADSPPPGRDPMDWFLFDHREGTCGIFSSAFVVLARSIGIPARVVSGWAIAAWGETQTVYTDQAHQWAEVAFDQLGWVSFEPTAPGGAPSRAPENRERDLVGSPPPPLDTITTITQWPSEVRRQTPFIIGGAVTTVDGQPISGMQVEIYVNETKEHGGDKIGTAMTTSDGYEAEVTLPANMNLGDYQLLARTVGTDDYNESWSDPDITVFSGSGLELTGPAEITVDVEATFRGRLLEDTGRVVTDREVTVTIDGNSVPSIMTDSSGQFALSRTFSSAGPHWIEVEAQGGEFLLDNTARLNFQVTLPTETVLHAPAFVEVGEEFRVTGELRDIRGMPLAGEYVYVQVGEGVEQTVVTDGSGLFQFTDTVYTAGEFTVSAEFQRNGPILSSNGTARLASQHNVVLTIDGPGRIEQGDGATFVGRLESDTISPTGQLELAIEHSLGQETLSVTTDEDGRFEYHQSSFQNTGPHSLTGRFFGGDYVGSSTAGIAFHVAAPTLVSLKGPKAVRDGEEFVLTGTLLQRNGRAVPDAEVQVIGAETLALVTDANGTFNWEAVAALDRSWTDGPAESEMFIEVDFAGTDHLGPSSASLEIAIGLPRIVVEALEPVARGATATLRGTVLVGNRPIADVPVSIDQEVSLASNEVGAFTYDYLVSPDMPLGTREIVVTAADIGVSLNVPIEVRSAPSLTFAQAENAPHGSSTLLSATLLDDKGAGIPRATLRSSQGVEAVTDDLGVGLMAVATPDSEDLAVVPVTFTFEGDGRNMPLSASFVLAVQPAPGGFNWLLWVGVPGLIALIVVTGFASRKLRAVTVPEIIRRRRVTAEPIPELSAIPHERDLTEGGEVEAAQPTNLEIVFVKAAQELPDVWETGEEVSATVRLTNWEGQAIGAATVSVAIAGMDASSQLSTNDLGACDFSWVGSEQGEYQVSAEYAGNDVHLPSSMSQTFRIVDFREEIVLLYNRF